MHVKRFESTEVDIQKTKWLSTPGRTGEILQERQPLSTAIFSKRGGDLKQEFQETPSEEEWDAWDQNPYLEARQDFWSSLGDFAHWKHVAPRTKLHVPKDDFPIPLNSIDVEKQTISSLDVLQESTIDHSWNMEGDTSMSQPWIGGTRFELPNGNPPEAFVRVQRQTHEETGHNKTTSGQKNTQICQKVHSAKPQINVRKIGRWSWWWRNGKHYQKKIGNKESLSDALHSHHTSQPERFKLGSTPCKRLV